MGVIVVATDGSAAAGASLENAVTLAQTTGDTIAVVTVWRALQGDFGVPYPSTAMLGDLLDAERVHAESVLEHAAKRCDDAGVPATTRLATGDPAERICAFADEIDATLIAVGTQGHGTVRSLIVGSVSSAVIRTAHCPVIVTRADGATRNGSTHTILTSEGATR